MIANFDHGPRVAVPEPDFDAAIVWLITDGVAQDILHRTAQQLGISGDCHRFAAVVLEAASVRLGFHGGILHQ